MALWEQELVQSLEKEKELLISLEKCSRQKTGIITKGDIETLNVILGREQPLVLRLQAAESKRLDIMKKYNLGGATLSEVAKKAQGNYKEIFMAQLKTITGITEKLKRTNSLNSELTKSRLEFYGKLHAMVIKPLYGNDGTASQQPHKGIGLIDQKV